MAETVGKKLEKMFFDKEVDCLSESEKEVIDKSLQESCKELEKEFQELEHIRILSARELLEDRSKQ